MTNHAPVFTSSSAAGSFSEFANTTDSTVLHQLTGTMNFKDSDKSDIHTTSASLKSAVLSSGSIIPASSLTHFQTAMSSMILSDSNGNGSLRWTFSDADEDFDFLSKNQSLTLTYNIKVFDDHGGFVTQTVKITVTGTDDKPVIAVEPVTVVTEQSGTTLSLAPDVAHIALDFTDEDLTNTGHTASVTGVSASGNTSGLLPGLLGNVELLAFFHVDNVVKPSGSSAGVINTTFAAPDLAFDYLSAGEQLNIAYTIRLNDNAGGTSIQTVNVTVVGTNDAPVFVCGPDVVHLTEGADLSPSGALNAQGDLDFTDVDLSDAHTVSTTVTASLSGGGAIPLSDAALLAAFHASLGPDSTGHLFGEVDWSFALDNNSVNFLSAGETLTLTYHVTIADGAGGTDTQDVTVTILGTNHAVVITNGPQIAEASELADTTGSAAVDTTTTAPSGTLDFIDADIGDTHTVAVTLGVASWSGGGSVPAATQADLANAVTAALTDSTGSGNGTIDWSFSIQDQAMDFLASGETLTVDYDVAVSDASTTAHQTVSLTVTGANDAVVMTGNSQSASVEEQADTTGSSTPDSTSPVPTGTLTFSDVDLNDTHTVSVSINSAVWSAVPDFVPSNTLAALQTALITALHDSSGSGSGGIDWNFSIPDQNLDFLSAGDTLTIVYDVMVSDGFTTSTQQVTITATGAADSQIVVNPLANSIVDTSLTDAGQVVAAGNLISDAGDSGGDLSNTLSVTDVSGTAVSGILNVAGQYGTLTVFSDGTYFYTANSDLDAVLLGQSPTEQFTFTVSDTLGHNVATTLTINVTGANEAPQITGGEVLGALTEDAGPTLLANGEFETGDFTGWTATGSSVQFMAIGSGFGNYTVMLNGTLSQDIATSPGQNYQVTLYVAGDPEAGSSSLSVKWDGVEVIAAASVNAGFTQYTFDVVGSASPMTQLEITGLSDGTGLLLDRVSVGEVPGPAVELADGSVTFSDPESTDTHIASFVPQASGYVGAFVLDTVNESGGSGSVGWHFTVDNAEIQFLAQSQTLAQIYTVFVTDSAGNSVGQDVTVTIGGANDAPAVMSDIVISDAGASGVIDIPAWALTFNDTDPDTTDHVSVDSIVLSSGGSAILFGDVFFVDDATLGGSFDYTGADGIATSANTATATVVNNATSATVLDGTGGDDIIIATNGIETLSGNDGNDILIGNSGSHVMTGGSGNDAFAFLSTSDGPMNITDFNNTTESDHIVISANGLGGGLTAGMDVASVFESSGDDQFSGSGAVFHFDNANNTLYFSADGTTASAISVATVQGGAMINPHDVIIV